MRASSASQLSGLSLRLPPLPVLIPSRNAGNQWALSVSGGSHIGRWRNQASVPFLIRFVDTLTDLPSRPHVDRNTTDSISSLPWHLSRNRNRFLVHVRADILRSIHLWVLLRVPVDLRSSLKRRRFCNPLRMRCRLIIPKHERRNCNAHWENVSFCGFERSARVRAGSVSCQSVASASTGQPAILANTGADCRKNSVNSVIPLFTVKARTFCAMSRRFAGPVARPLRLPQKRAARHDRS